MATSTVMKKLSMATLGAAFIVGTVGKARAASLIVPNGLADTEGNYANQVPFSNGPSTRYQQIFAASEFSSLSTPVLITQISFRPDGPTGEAISAAIPNIQINLSTTTATPDGLSTTFANNIGADDTVVFNGSLSLSSGNTGPTGGPKNFDIAMNLQNPFLYDPTKGNLLLDVKRFSSGFITGSSGLAIVFDAQNIVGDSISRRWIENVNSPVDLDGSLGLSGENPNDFTNSSGLVTQFTLTPVPEPSSVLGVLTLGAFSCGLMLKRKMKRKGN